MSNIILKQHNNFIEANYKLSLLEKKVVIGVAFLWQKQSEAANETCNEVTINAHDIGEIAGISPENFKHFNEIIKKLMSKVITVKNVEGGKESFFSFFSWGQYGEGVLRLKFVDEIKQFFFGLIKNFTIYGLENIKPLKSEYTIRIYEILKQYENTFTKKRNFSVDELRKLLGIKKNQYKRYNDFKKKIILTAQKEMELKTNLRFDFVEHKKGRKIVKIEFLIFKNKNINVELL